MKTEIKVTLTKFLAVFIVLLVFGGLFALFVNWIISLIYTPWEVSWTHWGITWAILIIIKTILRKG